MLGFVNAINGALQPHWKERLRNGQGIVNPSHPPGSKLGRERKRRWPWLAADLARLRRQFYALEQQHRQLVKNKNLHQNYQPSLLIRRRTSGRMHDPETGRGCGRICPYSTLLSPSPPTLKPAVQRQSMTATSPALPGQHAMQQRGYQCSIQLKKHHAAKPSRSTKPSQATRRSSAVLATAQTVSLQKQFLRAGQRNARILIPPTTSPPPHGRGGGIPGGGMAASLAAARGKTRATRNASWVFTVVSEGIVFTEASGFYFMLSIRCRK